MGAMQQSMLMRRVSFTPVSYTYTTGSGNVTVPSGATQVVVRVLGGGGKGGTAGSNRGGAGAGGSGYAVITKTLTSGDAGKTIAYSVGAGGTISSTTGGASTSSVTGFSFGSFSLSGNGGSPPASINSPGTGGTASGGDTNTTGGSGTLGSLLADGGDGGSGGNSGEGGTLYPSNGVGGAGGFATGSLPGEPGLDGDGGLVFISFT